MPSRRAARAAGSPAGASANRPGIQALSDLLDRAMPVANPPDARAPFGAARDSGPAAADMASRTVSSIRALAAELIARERWSRGRLADHQRQALASLVRHAATASPYYRERLARWSKGGDVMLTDLPV